MDLRSSSIFWGILSVSVMMFITLPICYEFNSQNASPSLSLPNVNISQVPESSPQTFDSPQLYIFGGKDERENFLSSAIRLNSTSGEWQSVNGMPNEVVQFCGAVVNNKVYLFGGFKGTSGNPTMMNTVNVYDSLTDTYQTLQPMPGPREGCGAAVLNGYIYVAGGSTAVSWWGTWWYKTQETSSSVLRYNIQTDRWSTVASMNNARKGLKLVELGGLLYAVGGHEYSSKSVEVYNATTDRWSFVARTKYWHIYTGAAMLKEKIYALSYNELEAYSPITNEWIKLKNVAEYRAENLHNNYTFYPQGTSFVAMNDKLWAVSGIYADNGKQIIGKAVHTYDPSVDQWTRQRDMDSHRMLQVALVVNH